MLPDRTPNSQRLLTIDDLLLITGYKARSTIYRIVHKGLCPAPVTLGDGRVRWREAEIERWLQTLPVREYPR
jgi:prophage regulatory protein